MGELIKIVQEEKSPQVQCPKCKKIQKINIEIFKKDISQIYRDNCIHCRTELNVGLIILVHPTLNGFLECLKRVIAAVNPGTYLKM